MLGPGRRRAHVLREDPELGCEIPPGRREAAERRSPAAIARVGRGTWDPRRDAAATSGGHGLLVLDGLLVRRIGFGRRWGAELLGPGDLIRPLDHDGEQATLPFEATWRVLVDARLALLDREWSYRMAAFPEVAIALTGRAMLRSRRVANTFAISQYAKLDARLHLLLWELADRFGRVRSDGVHIDLPLTIELLSHVACAHRPSVSNAIARLERAGLVSRTEVGWVLHGEPPTETTWMPPRR